jgi:hypothetical protein
VGLGPKKYNASAVRAITNSLTDEVAALQDGTNMSLEQTVASAMPAKLASGALETYGPFAWENMPGTRPLWKIAGVASKDVMDNVFYREVDDQVRKATNGKITADADDFDVMRQPRSDGGENILVFVGDGKGKTVQVQFSTITLRNRADAEARGQIAGAAVRRKVMDFVVKGDGKGFNKKQYDLSPDRSGDYDANTKLRVVPTQASKTDPGFAFDTSNVK